MSNLYTIGRFILLKGAILICLIAWRPGIAAAAKADSLPLPQAHAHNDYLHKRPLLDALDRGFTSVEADIHLVGDELYLGHLRPRKKNNRTLTYRYLEPLHALLEQNGGRIYPDYAGTFYLMIDVKTDAKQTCQILRQQLSRYPLFENNPYFRIFISGNRDIGALLADSARFAAIDGRPADLGKGYASHQMPVISDRYRSHFSWKGRGAMPEDERIRLTELAERVHREGKKLRLWGIPDRPACWQALLEAGVDLINTDRLEALQLFLTDNYD